MKIPLASEEGKGKKTRFGDIQSQNPGKPALSIEKPGAQALCLTLPAFFWLFAPDLVPDPVIGSAGKIQYPAFGRLPKHPERRDPFARKNPAASGRKRL